VSAAKVGLLRSALGRDADRVAFAGVPAWWLLCPYDTESLGPDVLEETRRSHPFVSEGGVAMPSSPYAG
jgi:hypothetical protein